MKIGKVYKMVKTEDQKGSKRPLKEKIVQIYEAFFRVCIKTFLIYCTFLYKLKHEKALK